MIISYNLNPPRIINPILPITKVVIVTNQGQSITFDEKKISKVDEAHYADAFKFVNELGKPLVKTFATAQILFAVVPFVVFIIG